MKKKLLVLGALLAIGANVIFVEAAGALTHTTAVEFKDESTSSSEFTNLTHLDNWPHFDKRGLKSMDRLFNYIVQNQEIAMSQIN